MKEGSTKTNRKRIISEFQGIFISWASDFFIIKNRNPNIINKLGKQGG
jgi:hypothetical protein